MEVLPDPESSNQVIIHLFANLLSPRFPRQPFNPSTSATTISRDEFFTTFALVIEPLILGVLPQTAVPALGWILVFGLGAVCTVPTIIRYLDTIGTVSAKASGPGSGKRKI